MQEVRDTGNFSICKRATYFRGVACLRNNRFVSWILVLFICVCVCFLCTQANIVFLVVALRVLFKRSKKKGDTYDAAK